MRVRRHETPEGFLEFAEALLLADEARHNLPLGLARTLVSDPGVYPLHDLFTVESGGRTVGAALRTPPHALVLAAPSAPAVLDSLSAFLAEEDPDLPGVIGGLPEAAGFAEAFAKAAGVEVSTREELGIYALARVEEVPVPSGSARAATPADLDILFAFARAFHGEADPLAPWDDDRARRRIAARIAAGSLRIWDDGGPVCYAGFGGGTPNGARIGPVYTPPEHRRLGYATALVAEVSAHLLAGGKRLCFLYTDMANPTSNAIYRRIGYRLVCDSAVIRFASR